MIKENNFLDWDIAPGNEMCFRCERADHKDKMCPWIESFEPVPGWVAIDASEADGIQSVKILRCPRFLDSPDDPGMTRVEYLNSCRELIVNLFKKVREFRSMAYHARKQQSILAGKLKLSEAENKQLKKRVAVDQVIEGILRGSCTEEAQHDQQQE